MPTYDYRCQHCGSVFEVFATFKQKEAGLHPECPECHSKKTEQIFRSLNIVRGSGGVPTPPPVCGPTMGPGCC